MIKILLIVLAGLALLGVLGFFLQPALIYFPESNLEGSPKDLGLPYQDVWLESSQGNQIHGWFIPGPQGEGSSTVLFLHGNAGNIAHRLDLLRIMPELGLSCLIIDYQGYGQSQGRPSEENMYQDAHVAWDFLINQKNLAPEQVVLWGHSLGGPVAAHLARAKAPAALILDSTFISLPEMGQKLYYVLPVKWFARFDYATQEYLEQTEAPVLIIHSPEDELVPIEMGRQLYQAAPGVKEFLEVRGGHDNSYVTSFDLYIKGVEDFLRKKTTIYTK